MVAYTSCRIGGKSAAPYDSLNVGQHVGDDAALVAANRALLPAHQNIVWLQQVHSNRALELPFAGQQLPAVDASYTAQSNVACAVMTADCLPILVCDQQGTWVAAIHAGWRGLADGVIENTLANAPCASHQLLAWMGPAISQAHFEVGAEVKDHFSAYPQAFVPSANTSVAEPKYMADLYYIARHKLLSLGLNQVSGGDYCTYRQQALFFSHRRATHQGLSTTGRMVSAIYLR